MTRHWSTWAFALLIGSIGVSSQGAQIFYESFENPVVAGKTDGVPTGWTNNPARVYKSGLHNAVLTGKTGNQFAFVDDYSSSGSYDGYLLTTSAILNSNLTAYIHYTLTCDVTGQSTGNAIAIDLIAGSTVLASVTNSVNTANNFTATRARLDFMAQPGHANLGEMLAIRLRMVAGAWNQDCYFDNLNLDATDSALDSTPPSPDPLTWVQTPTPSGSNSVIMTCTTASDTNWVEYMFSNTVTATTSGWIDVTTWQDNNLTHGVTYGYKVKARDKGVNKNETAWSSEESATVNSNIVFYDSFEYPTVSSATSKTDPAGWIDQSTGASLNCGLGYFADTSPWTNAVGDQAAWFNVYNTTPILETTTAKLDAVLLDDFRYTLRFNAADSGSYNLVADLLAGTNVVLTAQRAPSSQNFAANVASNAFLPKAGDPGVGEPLKIRLRVTGGEHNQNSYIDNLMLVAEPSSADSTPPTPDPMTWVQKPTPSENNGMYMVCSTASDINYVAYMFSNTVNGATSGWLDDPIWRDTGLTDGVTYSYKVKARDRSVNSNETAWSSEESAVADGDIIFYESFEYPIVSSATSGTDPENWNDLSTGGNGATRAGLGNGLAGYSNFEGAQAAWLNVYNSVPVLQTTSANFDAIFLPSCDYSLRFNAADNSTYVLYADMLAGTNIIMTAQVTPSSQNFSNHVAQQSFSSDIDDIGLGEPLSIRLRVTGGAWDKQSYVDNLKLTAVRTNAIWNIRATNITDAAADIVCALTATNVDVHVSAYWGEADGGLDVSAWANTNHLGWYSNIDFRYLTNSIASGLSENTSFYYAFRGSNVWEVWDSTSGVFTTTDVDVPLVDNSTGATSESTTSATLRGTLTNGTYANAWICWGNSDAGTDSTGNWDNAVSMGWISQDVEFSTLVTGLATNTTYWYRNYVTNSQGEDWSDAATPFNGAPISGAGGGFRISTMNGTEGVSGLVDYDDGGNFGGASIIIKNMGPTSGYTRKGYFRFDLSGIGSVLTNATLELVISVYNLNSDTTINVYGITNQALDSVLLTNGLPWVDAPANDTSSGYAADLTEAELLGSFTVTTGGDALGGTKSFTSAALLDFLNADNNDVVTLILGSIADTAPNLSFAGDTHSSYAPPTLDMQGGPAIANLAPTNITTKSVSFNATLETGATNYAVYVHWGTSNVGTNFGWDSSAYVGSWNDVAPTNISYPASGRFAGATNWYTFRASNDAGNVWASPSWQLIPPPASGSGSVFMFK